MANLIIFSGCLAAGKSTISKMLGETFGYVTLNKDEYKEIACDIFSYSNREENKKLSKCAMDNMIHSFAQMAKVGTDVILEANFRSEEVCDIADIASNNGYNVCLIFLVGDYSLLYDRFLKRLENRHRAHMSIGLQEDYDMFIEYNESLRNQDLVYDRHEIDITNLKIDEVLSECVSILRSEGMI